MGPKWLIILIGPVELIGMWFGEDQGANIVKKRYLDVGWLVGKMSTFTCVVVISSIYVCR
jgi:hypothetical protein